MKRIIIVGALAAMAAHSQEYSRGVGVYPGDPKEHFGPVMRVDSTYRNIALHRAAYQSSAYDYNHTAQSITDGIKDTTAPRWLSVSTSQHGVLPRNEREWPIDGNWVSAVDQRGSRVWIQFDLNGGDGPLEVRRISVDGRVTTRSGEPENWSCTVMGSDDGSNWKQLGQLAGMTRPGGLAQGTVVLDAPAKSRQYRLIVEDRRASAISISEVAFYGKSGKLNIGAGPFDFTSAWLPAGRAEEWVYVDLGAPATFDRVVLHWIRRASEASIQVSDDAASWKTIQSLGPGDEVKLAQPARGRYVRLLMTKPASAEGYALSEFEVYGRGGLVADPKPAPAAADGNLHLVGGAWKIQRAPQVTGAPEAISRTGFKDTDWIAATVPGTVLSSYYNVGAIPDPNFGANQLAISDSYFYSDFWYRNEFTAPAIAAGKHVWLNFDGVNWKADIYLNGEKVGRIDGGFLRGRFDVTRLLHSGQKNALAVRVLKNATPGSVKEKTFENPDKNGGPLGADNPTYHATIGWDWIPTMRGRDTGIWGDVSLVVTGPVTIEKPFVSSTILDTTRADVNISVTLKNHEARGINGTLRGRFGDVAFETAVELPASGEKTVQPGFRIDNPRLWWPNGYGDPNLYPVELRFEAAGVSDTKAFQAGIRQFTYSEDGGVLKMWINGRRFVPRGGNWGFGESMLRYRAREYDVAVRYHRDMNFTMIRNWVGQIGDDAFFEACDRHGIVVWQDFWLANPWDGPNPDDDSMFLRNARDFIERIRNHASIGLYCGRNEGYPPKPIDDGLRAMLAELHPGMHYISSSADDAVSGHGPYQAMPHSYYFTQRATEKFHSEMGMPNIVTMDSLKLMMPESAMWPQGQMWGLHDFCLRGAQGGQSYISRIEKSYGGSNNLVDWIELAQFVNYEGHRAMFEAQSKYRAGLLMWMSHPAWPSFVWQTYDYYFAPTAAYFAIKKASEPLHIQWNPTTENVEVVNYSGGNAKGLSATVQVFSADGRVNWEKTSTLDSNEDSTEIPFKIDYPQGITPLHFMRMKLSRGKELISENFYWRGTEEGNYQSIRKLPQVTLGATTRAEHVGNRWKLTTVITNPAASPALLIALKAVREKSGDRILPALYTDNYISLMPGEQRTIVTELDHRDTRGERPRIVVKGFNTTELSGN